MGMRVGPWEVPSSGPPCSHLCMGAAVAPCHYVGLAVPQSASMWGTGPGVLWPLLRSEWPFPPRSWFCRPLVQPGPRFCLSHHSPAFPASPDQDPSPPSSRFRQPRVPSPLSLVELPLNEGSLFTEQSPESPEITQTGSGRAAT